MWKNSVSIIDYIFPTGGSFYQPSSAGYCDCSTSNIPQFVFIFHTFFYSPTQRMLKQKPCVTDLLTSWSGRLSNPTWPPKLRLRFSSFWKAWDGTLDVWCMWGEKHMAKILTESRKTQSLFYASKHQRYPAQCADVKPSSSMRHDSVNQRLQERWAWIIPH